MHEPVRLEDYKPPLFAIKEVSLAFDIQFDCVIVTADSQFFKKGSASNLQLDGSNLELIHIELDGIELNTTQYHQDSDHLIIYSVPSQFSLRIITKIYPEKNTELVGLYKSGKQLCTQCEAQGFRRITYFLDRPDVMTVYKTKIIADKTLYPVILANGNLIDKGELPANRHWALWHDPFKKPSYLFALVAGQFDKLEDNFKTHSGRLIRLQIFVEPGDVEKAQHAMIALKKAMRWDEIHYELEYDLDLYMIVCVRDFNAGAMENKGLNIFNAQYVLARPDIATDDDYLSIESVIAHEYFHNWTGNRITCRDWFQLSLKEGLTIFRDQSFTEDTFSEAVARIRSVLNLRSRQFPEDASPFAHPVQPNSYIEISNFYSSTIYNKGAELIRMIKTILGKEDFKKGMKWYFKHYDGQAVTIEEFIYSFEAACRKDFKQFRLWYRQIGTPTVVVHDVYDEVQKNYTLFFKQELPHNFAFPLTIPIKVSLFNEDGKPLELISNNQSLGFETVLMLTEFQQEFIFEQIQSPPVPSLLRGFSAPVKINYGYNQKQLNLLFQYDTDSFNQWEAGQIQSANVLLDLINQQKNGENFVIAENFIEIFNGILAACLSSKNADKYFVAEILTLPSEKLLAEKMPIINPSAIHLAREFLVQSLAQFSEKNLLKVYENNNSFKINDASNSIEEMAKRRLKNLCLFYLVSLRKNEYVELCQQQFISQLDHNMTDTLGALRCLVNVSSEIQQEALGKFYAKWKTVPQVVDKWLGQQALSKLPDTLERVKNLLKHQAFSLTNPNQVYALIGTFTQQNPNLFHDASGAGYQFLAERVLELNQKNPILAAALVKPLLDWRRFEPVRQQKMREQIDLILNQKDLSKALYEVVSAGQ